MSHLFVHAFGQTDAATLHLIRRKGPITILAPPFPITSLLHYTTAHVCFVMSHVSTDIRDRKNCEAEKKITCISEYRLHVCYLTPRISHKHARFSSKPRFADFWFVERFTSNFHSCNSVLYFTVILLLFYSYTPFSFKQIMRMADASRIPGTSSDSSGSSVRCWCVVALKISVSCHAVNVLMTGPKLKVKIKDMRINCPPPFFLSQASPSDAPRLPRKSAWAAMTKV